MAADLSVTIGERQVFELIKRIGSKAEEGPGPGENPSRLRKEAARFRGHPVHPAGGAALHDTPIATL